MLASREQYQCGSSQIAKIGNVLFKQKVSSNFDVRERTQNSNHFGWNWTIAFQICTCGLRDQGFRSVGAIVRFLDSKSLISCTPSPKLLFIWIKLKFGSTFVSPLTRYMFLRSYLQLYSSSPRLQTHSSCKHHYKFFIPRKAMTDMWEASNLSIPWFVFGALSFDNIKFLNLFKSWMSG